MTDFWCPLFFLFNQSSTAARVTVTHLNWIMWFPCWKSLSAFPIDIVFILNFPPGLLYSDPYLPSNLSFYFLCLSQTGLLAVVQNHSLHFYLRAFELQFLLLRTCSHSCVAVSSYHSSFLLCCSFLEETFMTTYVFNRSLFTLLYFLYIIFIIWNYIVLLILISLFVIGFPVECQGPWKNGFFQMLWWSPYTKCFSSTLRK